MSDTTVALKDLGQQIAQQESQLKRLREEYEARQALLAELGQQRDALRAQLRQVEADIAAVKQGQAAAPSPKPAARGTLTEVLIEVVRQADRPQTARLLAEELARRNFPTKSTNVVNLVQNRLSELVKRGVFRRAKGQPGVLLGKAANGVSATKKAPAAAQKTAPTKAPSRPGLRKGQPSLRSLLTDILQKSGKPVAARDLAKQVLATGYKTNSQDFTGVVWTALGQLEGVENVKGQGWRRKKS
jgi:hypothetical protein